MWTPTHGYVCDRHGGVIDRGSVHSIPCPFGSITANAPMTVCDTGYIEYAMLGFAYFGRPYPWRDEFWGQEQTRCTQPDLPTRHGTPLEDT